MAATDGSREWSQARAQAKTRVLKDLGIELKNSMITATKPVFYLSLNDAL